ncbi:MAG: radical SAM protein, partial [Holophagae bacterium]|nr:radical SAM protein [Holophagae bacterium]
MNNAISPRRIRLEASSVCQLKCPSCPNTSGAIHPVIGRGFLKLQDFESLLKQNAALREIELSNYGEIFLNPSLTEIMRVAHEYHVALRMDTGSNLNTADMEQLEGLVKYRVRNLTCSLDGATQET